MTEPPDNTTSSFLIGNHARFVDGYLDAVGRCLTTDRELVALSTVTIESGARKESVGVPVECWEREFDEFAREFLNLDPRSRLGF